jgi:hypothetical protein
MPWTKHKCPCVILFKHFPQRWIYVMEEGIIWVLSSSPENSIYLKKYIIYVRSLNLIGRSIYVLVEASLNIQ